METPNSLRKLTDWNGTLYILDRPELPFEVSRAFFVVPTKDAVRGGHAHKRCQQLLICCSGEIKVTTESELNSCITHQISVGQSLLIPPMTWACQYFVDSNSILLVLCSDAYDESDYIRDKSEFMQALY